MSITDEMREYTDKLDKMEVMENLDLIADHIDEAIASEYVMLPVDADGVPIHVGDTVACAGSVWKVTGLRLTGSTWGVCCTIFNDRDGSGTNVYPPCDLRHHHEPLVEDVLRDFAYCCDECATEQSIDETIAEYAKKLRLVDGEES